MSHLLACLPKDVLWSIVVLAIHPEPLLLAQLAQQPMVPAWEPQT